MNEIGKKIKWCRTELGMTQEELGELLGVKKAAIQKYESSTVVNLKLETIQKLCETFDVSPNYLLGWRMDLTASQSVNRDVITALVEEHFGKESKKMVRDFYVLNDEARAKVGAYIADLRKIRGYRR